MTEKGKSYAGLLYQPADPELAADRDVTAKKLYDYNQLHPLDREARQAAIREILGKTGKNCVVEQPLFCTYGYNTTVGDNFFSMSTASSWTAVKLPLAITCLSPLTSALSRKSTPWTWSSVWPGWNTPTR